MSEKINVKTVGIVGFTFILTPIPSDVCEAYKNQ